MKLIVPSRRIPTSSTKNRSQLVIKIPALAAPPALADCPGGDDGRREDGVGIAGMLYSRLNLPDRLNLPGP